MPLTVAAVEQVVIRRLKGFLARVGLDVATQDGANPDLAEPIASSLRVLGYAVADPIAPTDGELAAVPDDDADRCLAVATLYTLTAAIAAFVEVDEQAGTDKQSWGQLGDRMEKMRADLLADLLARYGFGAPEPSCGVLDLGFQATGDCEVPW